MDSMLPDNLRKTVLVLTDDIGVRLAGSENELRAAEYLKEELGKFCPGAAVERFPVLERCVSSETYEVETDGHWHQFEGSLFSSAPGTDGRTVCAELVFFDARTGYMKPDLSALRGKAVVHLGCHIEAEDHYRRLMEAKPAFLLFVDTRFPGDIPLADGLFPAYVKKYGAVPSINVAYQEVWRWKCSGAARVRINVSGRNRPAETTVVTADLPGTDPDAGIIFVGGHHDTQAGTVGADDNAIGCAAVVELARMLSRSKHERTIRFCCFGAEEQLSAGSAAYVRKHRSEIESRGIFMCNFDSFGSALGWAEFTVNASDSLRDLIRGIFNRNGIYFAEHTAPVPYTDQFPFAACGVPGIWINRPNCNAGHFYHHRRDNCPDKIGFDVAAAYVSAASELLAELADRRDISSCRGIPDAMQVQVSDLFNRVFGGF